MKSHHAASATAHSVGIAADALSQRASDIERIFTDRWSGFAHDAMAAQSHAIRSELVEVPDALFAARRALEFFAHHAQEAERLRIRGTDVEAEASRLTRRWREDRESTGTDPGAPLRWRAHRMREEADLMEEQAGRRAANSVRASAVRIGARRFPGAGRFGSPLGILDDIGDFFDDVVDAVGDGLGWGWDRTTDLAQWAADQAENIVDGVVWVGDKAIEVGQTVVEALIDEMQAAYARARFQYDFAQFHLTGNTPDALPDLSDEYRRSRNVWSYSLIPAIEASGGECTQLDNGIFACLSDGIELPGDLGRIPLKGRGGTTYGEVFIVDSEKTYERVQEPGSPLADHEKNHSIQWAVHGPAQFVLLYLTDVALSGNNGADQYFEQQAGAEAGGYHD